jgi:PKD repeat protein
VIVSWFWEFGDEAISMDQNPIHAYSESGDYPVKLTVKTESGISFIATKQIKIVTPPFAFYDPNELCNNTVIFKDNSFTRASEVKLWMWDFGDGKFSLEKNPTHKFNKGVPQKVGLKIIDHNGCGDSISKTIHLKELPKTGFDIKNVNLENTAVLKIESRNQKDSVFYLINNDLIKSKSPQINIPNTSGINIKQKVIDKIGCSDSIQRTVFAGSNYYISIPRVFTIDHTLKINTFGITNSNVSVTDFEIYNVLGKNYFKGSNIRIGWDGKENSSRSFAPEGVYYYRINFQSNNGVKALQKGKFLVNHKN